MGRSGMGTDLEWERTKIRSRSWYRGPENGRNGPGTDFCWPSPVDLNYCYTCNTYLFDTKFCSHLVDLHNLYISNFHKKISF